MLLSKKGLFDINGYIFFIMYSDFFTRITENFLEGGGEGYFPSLKGTVLFVFGFPNQLLQALILNFSLR
jgi:hypothetical protein